MHCWQCTPALRLALLLLLLLPRALQPAPLSVRRLPALRASLLRGGASDDELSAAIGKVWTARTDRYSEIRGEHTIPLKKIEMSYIGG
jgi:molybdenum cofactor biosynthesis enzyme MoaA